MRPIYDKRKTEDETIDLPDEKPEYVALLFQFLSSGNYSDGEHFDEMPAIQAQMEIDTVDEEMLTMDPDTIMSMDLQSEKEKARIYMDEDDLSSDYDYSEYGASSYDPEDPEYTPEKDAQKGDANEADANEEPCESDEPLEYDSQYESDSQNDEASTIEGDDAGEVPSHEDLAISLQVESTDTSAASGDKVLVTSLQKEKKKKEEAGAVSHPKTALFTSLQMYLLAKKYQVHALRLLAQERFMRSAEMYWIKQDYRVKTIEDVKQTPRPSSHWMPYETRQDDKPWKTQWTNADGFVKVIDDLFTYTEPKDPLRRYICNLISHDFSMQADIREKLGPLIQKHQDFAVRMLDTMVCYAGLNERATRLRFEEAARQLRCEDQNFDGSFSNIKDTLERTLKDLEEYRSRIRRGRDLLKSTYKPSL